MSIFSMLNKCKVNNKHLKRQKLDGAKYFSTVKQPEPKP